MAISIRQFNDIITGVWALFLRKNNALSYFKINSSSFAWSFSIIIMVIVFQLYMTPIEIAIFNDNAEGISVEQNSIFFQMFILTVNWFSWPFIAYLICKLMGVSEHFIRYVTIDNWSSIVTLTIIAAPVIMFQFGGSSAFSMSAIFFTSMMMLLYKWRVARVALATTGINAAILLFIDLAYTIIISSMMKALFN